MKWTSASYKFLNDLKQASRWRLVMMSFAFMILSLTNLQAQPILVINNSNAAPHSTAARNGYVDLITAEAFRRIGFQLQLIHQPPERGLINADNGNIDGDLTRIAGIDSIYPNLLRVPEKLLDWDFAVFSKSSKPINSWQLVYDHPVAFIKGWKIYEQKLAGAKMVNVVESAEQLFQLLSLSRVDSVLYERWQGLALIQQLGLQPENILTHTLEKRPMFIYLNKRHADLLPQLAAALHDLKTEGFYQDTYNKTLAPYNIEVEN